MVPRRVAREQQGQANELYPPSPTSPLLLHALRDLTAQAVHAATPSQVAGVLAEQACALLAAHSASVYLSDPAGHEIQPVYTAERSASQVLEALSVRDNLAQRVFTLQQPLLAPEIPPFDGQPGSRAFRVLAGAPLQVGCRTVGVLTVCLPQPGDESAVMVMLSLLASVGTALLDSARLRAEQRDHQETERALLRATQALAVHTNDGRVLWLVARTAAKLLHAAMARVWIRQPDGSFVCVAGYGYLEPDPIHRQVGGAGMLDLVAGEEVLNLRDAATHPAWTAEVAYPYPEQRAYLGAALRRSGELQGVLFVMRAQPFERRAEQLLAGLASTAAVAVHNARMVGRVEAAGANTSRGARHQALLGDLALGALATADSGDLLRTALDVVLNALDAESALILSLDEQQQLIVRVASGGAAAAAHSLASYILARNEQVVVNDLAFEQRFDGSADLLAAGWRSAIGITVAGRGGPVGVIVALSRRPAAFSVEQLDTLQGIANVLGLALARSDAEDTVQHRQRALSALVEHAPDLVARMDRSHRFAYVNPAMERAVGRHAADLVGESAVALALSDAVAADWGVRLHQVFRSGRGQTFSLLLDGMSRVDEYEAQLIPEPARDGSVASVLMVAREIGERKRAVQQLEEQRQRLIARELQLLRLVERLLSSQEEEHRRHLELAELEPLTEREQEVLQLLARGRTTAEIASALGTSSGTVKNHISRILPKLEATHRTHAVARAVELGLVRT
jgi:PAS domain S-box-containing protein